MFPTQEAQSSQGCAEGAMGVTVASREAEDQGVRATPLLRQVTPTLGPISPLG